MQNRGRQSEPNFLGDVFRLVASPYFPPKAWIRTPETFVPICRLYASPGFACTPVWKLDRLGRSLQHLIDVVTDLENRQIGFQSLTENIDTTSPTGKLIFHIFGSLAEFERGLIRERVKAGLDAAKKKGKKFGRPDALNEKDKDMALAMFNGGATKIDIARHFKVTRQTIYTLLKEYDT